MGKTLKTGRPVKVFSFGYRCRKHRWPKGTLVYDAQDLPDPSHDLRVRHLNGLDPIIQSRVLAIPGVNEWITGVEERIRKSKNITGVAIGSFGGVHRSVSIAEEFARRFGVKAKHTDLAKRDPLKNIPHPSVRQLSPNTYQPSPRQERRSSPSGRRAKKTRDRKQ
jgi:UPF0042 nucleotide-binding protein